MLLLLDEDVPKQALQVLRHLLRGHQVDHLIDRDWRSKADTFVFRDAAKDGYEALLTNNHKQLNIPKEVAALKKSGMHHISYGQTVPNIQGLALALGAMIAAMPAIIHELDTANSQRLVRIHDLKLRQRYDITDPRRDPPTYWPR